MMTTNTGKLTAAAVALLATTALTAPAQASHFRGAAMVPSVNANGLLTVESTSFWRPSAPNSTSPSVSGVGGMTFVSTSQDTSDIRFTQVNDVHQIQLPGAGTYNITWGSCCRVDGIQNWGPPGGNSSVSWTMNSTIVWDGSTANTPILFDFSAIQPEVVRGVDYAGNLGATVGTGGTLSYNQTLNGIPIQTPGFTIDPVTGALDIPAASTATLLDNNAPGPSPISAGANGADYAFSGNIINSDGSSVEFDWLFDAVDTSGNLAPSVTDHLINAMVGDNINQIVTGTDANAGDDVTLSLLSFFGPSINIAASFVPGAPGNPTTGTFSWDTTGSGVGIYIANIRGSDGQLTGSGTITINLTQGGPGPGPVPEPGTLVLLAGGLLGLAFAARRRRSNEG
jgi:hypothetical protein